jgi:hypothetical protein
MIGTDILTNMCVCVCVCVCVCKHLFIVRNTPLYLINLLGFYCEYSFFFIKFIVNIVDCMHDLMEHLVCLFPLSICVCVCIRVHAQCICIHDIGWEETGRERRNREERRKEKKRCVQNQKVTLEVWKLDKSSSFVINYKKASSKEW